ncbi:MAG: hypothetical protein ACRETQ_06890 [Gammaproteobacteria bacterium]
MRFTRVSMFTIALALVATCVAGPVPAVVPANTKMARPIQAIAHAVAADDQEATMQAALTRQLFREAGPFAARWNASGQVQIYAYYARFEAGPDPAALQDLGASEVRVAPLLHVVQAWVPAGRLAEIAALPWVQRLAVPQYALGSSAPPLGGAPNAGSAPPSVGQFLGAAAFSTATGDTGQGIMVGVISSGAAGISQSQANGDLPPSVWVDPNSPGDTTAGAGGEGTAMLEIVHTLAPGAGLAFCGPQTTADFLTCLNDLQNHGAQIIVDDLTFPVTAYFTNDSDVLAVQEWQAQNPTVRLVTAAGNFATSFWSGTYNVYTLPTPVTVNGVTYTQANNFGTNAAPSPYVDITVAPGQLAYVLEWDDPWVLTANLTSSTPNDPNDYDAVLYDANGNVLACNQGSTAGSTGCNQAGAAASATPGPQPVQANQWTNNSTATDNLKLAVYYRAGTPGTALKLFVASPDSCEVLINPVNPVGSIVGHAQLPYPAEITVGALYGPDALNQKYALEGFSSQGPVNLPLLPAGGQTIPKPDFVGVDGIAISGAGGFPPAGCGEPAPNPPVFYGTSAAAPGIAALIALLESAGYTSDQVYGVLQSNSIGLAATAGGPIPNGLFGYGLPNIASVKAATPPPPPPPSTGSGSGKSGGGGGVGLIALVFLLFSWPVKMRRAARIKIG